MANKKKQHFVPKLLLRYFATDENKKLINIFNVETNFYRENCPLKDQGQEDYFYGEDGIIEDMLAKLEDESARIISDMLKNKQLPKYGTKEHQHLFLFTMFMSFRTKSAAEMTNAMFDKVFQEIKKYDSRFSDEKYKDIHLELKKSAPFTLANAGKDIFLAYDLESKLLYNATNTKFITSDHPVIKYNQFLEQRKHPGGHTGLLTKGLQIFFPITPEFMIVYYDKWAYKFGNKKNKLISITDCNDIEQLNYLQVLNCSQIAYYNNETKLFTLKKFAEKAQRLRNKDKIIGVTGERKTSEDGNESMLMMHYGEDRETNLTLSFVKQPQNAKSHVLTDYYVQLRNERLRNNRPR